jgi:hypothetical protein
MKDNEGLVGFPACYDGRLTRAQSKALANDRHAWNIAAHAGRVTRERFDGARKAVRAVLRAGRLQVRVMEAENDTENFKPDGSESPALRSLRHRVDLADRSARDRLRPFGYKLVYPGPYPLVEPTDGNGPKIFPEY